MDLAELSRMSRVSRRTIRYYIHQGLLPSPGKRGRGARYDRGLLDRLELIKQLQRGGWPLARIAERMRGLDPAGVQRELKGGGGREEGEGGTSSVPAPPSSILPQIWERVRVAPNVEISVRTPLPPDQRKRVDRLIDVARQTLREE